AEPLKKDVTAQDQRVALVQENLVDLEWGQPLPAHQLPREGTRLGKLASEGVVKFLLLDRRRQPAAPQTVEQFSDVARVGRVGGRAVQPAAFDGAMDFEQDSKVAGQLRKAVQILVQVRLLVAALAEHDFVIDEQEDRLGVGGEGRLGAQVFLDKGA